MVHLKVSYLFGCCMDLACILNRMRYQTGLGCVASGVDLGDDSNDGRAKRYQQSKLANCVFTMALKVKLESNAVSDCDITGFRTTATNQAASTLRTSMRDDDLSLGCNVVHAWNILVITCHAE